MLTIVKLIIRKSDFYLYIIPLIILLITFLFIKKKGRMYTNVLKIITLFSVLTFSYSLILGLIFKVSVLGLSLKSDVSIFSLINNSIIFLGNKESKIECIKIVNKEINKTHGVRYYYVLDNIGGHQDVEIQIFKKTFNDLKDLQYIRVKYYSIGNLDLKV